ncbi:MAG TPA: hypothetical protein VNH44_10460 [Micropepsaceae bacterium]|nr:hypothetical protein [Micropepsaceae bacterium]
MSDLVTVILVFLVGMLIYGFRRRLLEPLRRFETRNARRRAEEARALYDKHAHYRQTVEFAQEEIEEVAKITARDERTGEPVARYLFLGDRYPTRSEAEAVRFAMVIEKAREFYKDLDRLYLARRGKRPAPMANPEPADPSKHETYTPPQN